MAAAPLNEVLKGGPNIAPTRGEQGCGRYVLWVDGGADPISFYPYGVGPVEKRRWEAVVSRRLNLAPPEFH